MKRWMPTPDAYKLFHETQIALAEVEAAGVRVDKAYLDKAVDDTQVKIRDIEKRIRSDPLFDAWRRRYGDKTNVGSSEQLSYVVFHELGHKPPKKFKSRKKDGETKKRESASESALEGIDLPFVKLYFQAQKLRKAYGTYLMGIRREIVQHGDGNWYVHPSYNLNTVETFRSSCNMPNFQNNPNRNPEMGELTRRMYIPRPGQHLMELDYGQIEVRIPCCYNFDPTLISYVCDPTKDMHRDMAAQIFMVGTKQVSKDSRSTVKNMMVFPTFYGSYFAQIAPSLWEAAARQKLMVEGTTKTVREHLADKGIAELGACDPDESPVKGTFEYHMKEIEEHFWNVRFPVYTQWKKDWLAAYRRDGGCQFLTGFIMKGPHAKNDIINYAIQGTAFHCTAWSLVRIVNTLRKYKFKTKVIGEVHDSINKDGPPRERDDVLHIARKVMTEDIKKWAPWLNVPLVVEAEMCPVGRSWFEKFALKEEGGKFVPSSMEKWVKAAGPWSLQVEEPIHSI